MNNRKGVENSLIIANEIKDKKLRNIIIILKILLKINNLDNASSKGMNSYLLFHFVYYFAIIREGFVENELKFLQNFLHYYGFEFNNNEYMLNMMGIKSEMIPKKVMKILSVKTTLSKNDIGGQCEKYNEIKELFQKTYEKISSCIDKMEFSILHKLNFPINNLNL